MKCEQYNSNAMVFARLAHNICVMLLVGGIGYMTMSPWVLLGLVFCKHIAYTPDNKMDVNEI